MEERLNRELSAAAARTAQQSSGGGMGSGGMGAGGAAGSKAMVQAMDALNARFTRAQVRGRVFDITYSV